MPAAISFEENKGLVHLQAKLGFKWAQGAGTPLDYDDMFQEASLAFVIAAEGFNPDAGVKFSAYYAQVCFSHFRKAVGLMTGVKNLNEEQREEIAARKEENARRAKEALPPLPDMNYGLRPISFSELAVPGDDDGTQPFEATIAAEEMDPEEQIELRQIVERATANLSPLAALVVEWLKNPPPEMLAELELQAAHVDQCHAVGARTRGLRDGITIGTIGKFLKLAADVPKQEMLLVEAELMGVARQIEEAGQ